ncbi:hypothetical protein V5O48_003429 [Marasmius crinis-equi]|uniref:Uncharacterized protein n=1 Tax=Marasmius crinis-equi TaxID=585013 RepID=A0ABR3FSY9_9AGAR
MSTFTNESESGICHSDRLSFENFTLERTIEVRLNGTTATGSPTARFVEAAQALGSQPTGSVGLNGGSRSYGNIGVAAATVPLVVGLFTADAQVKYFRVQ